MGNRLIFRYRPGTVRSEGVTQEGRCSGPLVEPVQAGREGWQANPLLR